jgi:hypothetical protein
LILDKKYLTAKESKEMIRKVEIQKVTKYENPELSIVLQTSD